MSRILEAMKVRPGEERMVVLLVGLMLFTAAGGAIGGNATEALFFARFGVELLPVMYVILGLFTFITSMVITVIMGRIPRQRLFVILPFVIAFLLIAEWLIIPLNLKWFFAVMWLGMNVIGSLQGLLTWGLAGAACDTRQAKRLFPLFGAGGILGTVFGGLLTQPLAGWLHSENLLLIWAGALFISFFLGRALVGRAPAPRPLPGSHVQQPGVIAEMQRGYMFVRHSTIMQWVSYSAVLFSVCYFSLALPFSRGATAQFPDADQLAGFLGLFQSLNTAAALLASLFFANRLFARFGIMPMLLLFPVIYLAGFAVLGIYAPFMLLIAARFAQMTWMQGIANPAWQALFNVVPPDQRDQVRAFVGGVPEQAGTFIAGLILLVGEQALQPQQLYFVGLAAAALLVYILWRASRAYSGALVEALRVGQPQMFFGEDQPFGGFRTDAAAVKSAIQGVRDSDPAMRRVSAEILGNLSVPEAAASLVEALEDDDGMVRAAAIRGLARAKAAPALLEIAACLSDEEADVRLQAVIALRQLTPYAHAVVTLIERLLGDPDLLVRTHAALALVRLNGHPHARRILNDMAADTNPAVRVQAVNALGECGDETAFDLAVSALGDEQPMVRKAAPAALASIHPQRAAAYLISHLDDDEPSVRRALAEALGKIGPSTVEPLVEALEDPDREDGALMALELLPGQNAAGRIRAHAVGAARTALRTQGLALGLAQKYGQDESGDGRWQLLVESLSAKAQRSGLNALRAIGLIKSRQTIAVAVENLRSREAAQRANALETLESVGEREIIRPLLALWEAEGSAPAPLPEGWLDDLLRDPDPWLRACAVLVAAKFGQVDIFETLRSLAQSDPDFLVRDVAEKALHGETPMDTLATLSLMERILFLRRVPIFADLPPADLKQVAAVMREVVFAADEALVNQGELGDEMFIIVSGEVRVLVTPEHQKDAREVARRLPGDQVGEMAIISREPRFATLIAVGVVRALCINQKQFEGILRERPEICLAMMRVLSQRLKEASKSSAEGGLPVS